MGWSVGGFWAGLSISGEWEFGAEIMGWTVGKSWGELEAGSLDNMGKVGAVGPGWIDSCKGGDKKLMCSASEGREQGVS